MASQDRVRHALLKDLDRPPGAPVEGNARIAVALPEALHHDHQIGPHRLRAGVAAPDATSHGRDEEQRQRRQHQQAGDEIELLRPDLEEEKEEAVVGHVEQHGLVGQVRPAMPAQPRQRVVDAERRRHHQPLDGAEAAMRELGVDLLAVGVERAILLAVDRHGVEARDTGRGLRDVAGWDDVLVHVAHGAASGARPCSKRRRRIRRRKAVRNLPARRLSPP